MNAHEFDSLACEVLEGTATAEDRRKLDAWVASHPDDRERFERFRDLFSTLSRVPSEEAPAGLREAVVGAIRAAGTAGRGAPLSLAPPPASVTGRAFTLRSPGPRRRLFDFALPFAAGLAAGVLILAGWMGSLPARLSSHGDVAGSMVPPGEARDWHFALGTAQIEPRLWSRPGSSSLRLRVRNARDLALELRYDVSSQRVARVQADLASGAWQLTAGRLDWRPEADDELTIELAQPGSGSALQLAIQSPDGRREVVLVPARGAAR